MYQNKSFFLCKALLDCKVPNDIVIISQCDTNEAFPKLYEQYDSLRSHAYNKENIYSVIRAKEIVLIVHASSKDEAQQEAYEKSKPDIITKLLYQYLTNKDSQAYSLLTDVHNINPSTL